MPARSCAHRVGPAVALVLSLFLAACDAPPPTATPFDGRPSSSLLAGEKEVIVGFASIPGDGEIAKITAVGGRVIHQYRYVPFAAAVIPQDQEDVLRATAGVLSVEDNPQAIPFGGKQIVDYGVQRIDAAGAWALGYSGQGVKVGIMDSGADLEHPDLVVAGGIDFVGDGRGIDDCNGHGTHVGGIAGAANNGNHTVGVAPKAQVYHMRVFSCAGAGGGAARLVAAMEWAIANGMDVVNMSLGFGIAGVGTPTDPSSALRAVMDTAYARGVVLVAASGNSGVPYVSYPAAYKSVIAVGATDDADMLASFSQYGQEQEVTAPGVNNLASYLVGEGREGTLLVRTDGDRELSAVPMQYSGMTKQAGISAPTIAVNLGLPEEYAGVNCAGKTVLVARGGITFAEKVRHAQNAGCAAVIIHNNAAGNFNGTLGTPDDGGRAWIPAQSISLEEGLYLRDQIGARATETTLINAVGNLALLSGTSMASPHVTGVVALILSRSPNLTPVQVREVLRASSEDLGAPGWDPVFGHGRINARRAVERTP